MNISTSKRTGFEIDPARLIAAKKRHRSGHQQLIGYFHSHPNGRAVPSPTDAAMAAEDGRYWVIAAGERLTAWKLASGRKFRQIEVAIV